jgi:hypothetical protein
VREHEANERIVKLRKRCDPAQGGRGRTEPDERGISHAERQQTTSERIVKEMRGNDGCAVFRTAWRALISLLLMMTLLVALLDDGSGEDGPPDPLPPIETDV